MLHMPIAPASQELLDCCDELAVKVLGEAMTRVVGEDAHQHDRIVLDMVRGLDRSGEVFANAHGGLFGGCGARLGALNDEREVNELISLLERGFQLATRSQQAPSTGGGIAMTHTVFCGLLLTSQKVVWMMVGD